MTNLERIEGKAILVGGAVRDALMGKESKDLDYLVLGETVESMLEAGFTLVGADFPVFLHPITKDEYALARIERKTGKGYTEFSCETNGVSFEEDMSRRDLTINAMGRDKDGNILDPFNGQKDLEDKILRHTTVAFAEDPLRVLRLARFNARYPEFTIAKETKELAISLKEELSYLTPERVFKELEKVLGEEKPSVYFRTLLELEALEVVHPEIFAMVGVPQRFDYHAEGDVFEHTMRVLDEISKRTTDIVARYTALYHDVGKPVSFNRDGNFYAHSDESTLKEIFAELKDKKHPNRFTKMGLMVAEYHTFVHGVPGMKPKTLVKKMTNKSFPSNKEDFEILLLVSGADEVGRILGTRTLTFDEVEDAFNGSFLDGFSQRDFPKYERIRLAFEELSKKVELPKNIIEGPVGGIKDYIYRTRVDRVSTALKDMPTKKR